MLLVPTIEALMALPPDARNAGTLVYVSGYYAEEDGGGMQVRWVPSSAKAHNGGTVLDPEAGSGKPGRWEQIHNGIGDFRKFGLFDATKDADDALDAMMHDPAVRRIEAYTNLNFSVRHTYDRSNIELDFHNNTVTTVGIELNTKDNPFGAVLCFRGTATGVTQTVTLSAELAELTDVLEVYDATAFKVEEWWLARVSNHPAGGAQRELDYLLRVTEIIDTTHVRVNYKLGWPLAAGRQIQYKQMNPVFRSHVRNMRFEGVPVPPSISTTVRLFDTWDQIGSNPVAYEFAVECDVSGIYATKVFWPVIERRYCSHYVTERCELINPVERDWGGTGYLTQQLNVLYGHVKDCNTSNSRHLNDFTCAAYCMVENCHGDGDDYGPFVTHGQFEHDLVFVGNSGLLSFANSGTTWGNSAKRITVKKHVASRVVAHKWLTDLTLEDVHAVKKEGLIDSGSIWANVDGLQMRGCTAEAMLTLTKGSNLARRKNVIDGCSFGMLNGYELARPIHSGTTEPGYTPVNDDLTIVNSEFYNIEDVDLGSINKLTLTNTWFKGASGTTGRVRVGSRDIVMLGGGFVDCGFVLTGAWDKSNRDGTNPDMLTDQSISIDGGVSFHGTNGERAFLKSVDATNVVKWSFGNCTSQAADADTAHFHIEGGSHKLKAVGSVFEGGKYEVADGSFGGSQYFLLTSCVEEGVNRTSLPVESDTVKHRAGNIFLTE